MKRLITPPPQIWGSARKRLLATLAAALAAMVIAAPVHAYTAEDCKRGYRIYNHPSKGEQRVPV
ncbi:MAG: hypothetical protein OXC17_04350, partial [Aestuariivita sp.]|nr:hypothetical protein [Aestuariivita sp.]